MAGRCVDGTDAKVGRAFERIDRILEEIIVAAGSADEMGARRAAGAPCGDEAFVYVLLSLQSDSVGHGSHFSRDNVKALLEVKELHACSNCFTLF
jgi:cytochrome P450 family 1 subfamily D